MERDRNLPSALTFHELRQTYASILVNHGVALAYVAAQLGHTDTRMFEQYYGHLCPNAQAEAIRSQGRPPGSEVVRWYPRDTALGLGPCTLGQWEPWERGPVCQR